MNLLESGELYVWGYGKAIGYRYKDIVSPVKKLSHYTNIVQLAGGATHSLALTGLSISYKTTICLYSKLLKTLSPPTLENGNVYSWGAGTEGQLGHGKTEIFLAKPTKISKDFLPHRIAQICGGSFISLALSSELSPSCPHCSTPRF